MPGGAEILTERLGQGGQSVSENSAFLFFLKQMSVAVGRHPACSVEVGLMDLTRPDRFQGRIDPKDDLHNFSPFRTFVGGVK